MYLMLLLFCVVREGKTGFEIHHILRNQKGTTIKFNLSG